MFNSYVQLPNRLTIYIYIPSSVIKDGDRKNLPIFMVFCYSAFSRENHRTIHGVFLSMTIFDYHRVTFCSQDMPRLPGKKIGFGCFKDRSPCQRRDDHLRLKLRNKPYPKTRYCRGADMAVIGSNCQKDLLKHSA